MECSPVRKFRYGKFNKRGAELTVKVPEDKINSVKIFHKIIKEHLTGFWLLKNSV